MTDIERKYSNIKDFRFSIAPMMDWSEKSK